MFEPGIFADLVGYVEADQVHPIVAGTYPLEEKLASQAAVERKEQIGSVVITIG
ncbi:MAG: hypothetical protein WBM50_21625 [Acidimicrobiales bacterium]